MEENILIKKEADDTDITKLIMKKNIVIKEETDDSVETDPVVQEIVIVYMAGEYIENINNYDLAALNNMMEIEAALVAMQLPNGIIPPNARAMLRASRNFIKNMKQLLNHAHNYETNALVAVDYDLQDETKICSLGWYARLARQTLNQKTKIGDALRLKCYSRGVSVIGFLNQLEAGIKLLSALRSHARARFPNYHS